MSGDSPVEVLGVPLLPNTCSHTRTQIQSHTHTFAHVHTLTRAAHSHACTHIHTLAHSCSLTLSLTLAFTHNHTLTVTHIHIQSHALTHSHTHTPPFPAHGGLCHRDRARRWGWLAAPIVCGRTKRLSPRGGHLLLCRVDPKPRPVTGRPAGAGHLGKPPCRSLPCIVQVHPWSPCPGNLCRCPADMGQA